MKSNLFIPQMLTILNILFLLQFINGAYSNLYQENPYDQAKKITAEKQLFYERLQDKYNTSDDYTRNFNLERTPPTDDNLKADVLLQFHYLVKYRGYCRMETFQDCVNYYGKSIPNEEKCPMRLGDCDENSIFTPIGGYCNNLENPNLGRSNTAYIHILKPVYADGTSKIRTAASGMPLPSPRSIGNLLANPIFDNHYDEELSVDTNNLMGLMFGQFLTHDVSNRLVYHVKGNNTPSPRCCTLSNSNPLYPFLINPNCIPVNIPINDPFYSSVDVRCQNYIRMAGTVNNDCSISYAQVNQVSTFLDLTTVYSDSSNTLATLRTNSSGLLRTNPENILPQSSTGYIAGDSRVNQTPMLALVHSLFFRLHNEIAKNLAKINPNWDDNELFFNSRRINIAIYQSIVYNEWLPLFIGERICEHQKLRCGGKTKIKCDKYDCRIDPSASAEYSHAAFRFFHKNIPSIFQMYDNRNQLVGELLLSDVLLNNNATILQEKYEFLLNGMLKQKIAYASPMYSSQIRDLTAKVPYKGKQVGSDQFLNDLMRGRDSGSGSFIDFIEYCTSEKIKQWSDLRPYFKDKEYQALRKIYQDVRDIDLLVGILLETYSKNRIGNIGACIIANQYYRLRYGDRFFYSNPNNPNKFTAAQINEIENTTFAKVLCLVTNSTAIPREAFVTSSNTNPLFSCEEMFDFGLFVA